MKKNYFAFFVGMALCNLVWATIPRVNHMDLPTGRMPQIQRPAHLPYAMSLMPAADTSYRWYSYAETMDAYQQLVNGSTGSVLNYNYLFSDSTILAEFGTTIDRPWIHSIGNVLDISSSKFYDPLVYYSDSIMHYSPTAQFKVDSLMLIFAYFKNLPSVTDSIVIEVAVNNTTTQLPTYYFSDAATNTNPTYWFDSFGDDTVRFKALRYAFATNAFGAVSTGANKRKYTIALTDAVLADTLAGGLNRIKISCANLALMNAGSKNVISNVKFKPGYTWVNNVDTLNSKNYMYLASYEETDAGFPTYTPNDYNSSGIVRSNERYNITGNGFNGFYVPSYAFGDAFAFEHHLIYYRISNNTLITGQKSDKVLQAEIFPNPGSSFFQVNLTANAATSALIRLYDLQGREVEQRNVNTAGGVARETFDASHFASGTYLLRVEQAGMTGASYRVVIQH
jgi:hypothetical protein